MNQPPARRAAHAASLRGETEETPRWHPARTFFRARLGAAVRKVPLDAGLSCPNRDGTLSHAGCSFCNASGSGTGLYARGLSLTGQWARLAPRAMARDPRARLLAYLQSFSNTHTEAGRLAAILAETAALPGVAGLCLGTRPDCLDADAGWERLDVLAHAPLPFVQLDLGLQSADPEVLERCGRGHGPDVFARAARAAAARGLHVCAHLLHGLPGSRPGDLIASVRFLNALPVAAVKFHNLLVCRGAGLAASWRRGEVPLPTREAYVAELVEGLRHLRPDISVQRLFADPAPGELLAPDWALDKAAGLALARAELLRQDAWQGQAEFCPSAPPDWAAYYQ